MCWVICRIKRQLFSYKMTSILFWNIKWLFVGFTFCHKTTVTLDTQWQNARTFLERKNLPYTTEHDSKLSRYRIQNNCSMCPPFTRTTAFSLSRHWSMDLLVICWLRLSQQVRTLSLRSSRLEIGMRYTLCCRAPQTAQSTGFKSGLLGGHTDGSMKFGTVRWRNSTVDFARWDGAPSCWNTKWSSDFWRVSGRRHRCSKVSR